MVWSNISSLPMDIESRSRLVSCSVLLSSLLQRTILSIPIHSPLYSPLYLQYVEYPKLTETSANPSSILHQFPRLICILYDMTP
jgi:hypothetical protein